MLHEFLLILFGILIISICIKLYIDCRLSPIIGGRLSKKVSYFVIHDNDHKNNIKYHLGEMNYRMLLRIGRNRVPDKCSKKVRMALSNKNTIDFLRWQNLDRYKKFKKLPIYEKFLGYKFPPDALIKSSFISHILGVRTAKDLDVYFPTKVDNIPSWIDSDNIEDDSYKLLSSSYKTSAVNLNNDDNYMYWHGVKCQTLQAYLYEQFLRQRPKAIATLHLVKKYTKLNPKIPDIPDYKLIIPYFNNSTTYITQNHFDIRLKYMYPDYKQLQIYKKYIKNRIIVDKKRFQRTIYKWIDSQH